MDPELTAAAERVAALLISAKQTVGVAESSAGGLISAALLSVPGASAYYLGGGVIYTPRAFRGILQADRSQLGEIRSSTEPYALFIARNMRERLRADWCVSETGASGPTGNIYGDDAGHTCVGVTGPMEVSQTLETGLADRSQNMVRFALKALTVLGDVLEAQALA
jgi:PncC family amidohydrolase